MMTDGYSAIYEYYDQFTGNVDYGRRADFIDGIFRRGDRPELVLDAGCGTGTLMSMLIRKGYDVIGIDSSQEMLSVAAEKNPGQLLLCQDIVDADLYGTVQGIVCMQDTLNHLSSVKEVEDALCRLSLFLEKDRYFLFDINSEYKHRNVLSCNTFVYEADDAVLLWQNNTDEELTVHMTLDLFRENEKGLYSRDTGFIDEILINEENVLRCLKKAGLELVDVIDGDSLEPLCDISQRLLYITRKK